MHFVSTFCCPAHAAVVAGLDRVVVAVIDSGVELSSGGVGPAVWANSAEVAGDDIDNDGNGEDWGMCMLPA